MSSQSGNVTRLLSAFRAGDRSALDELMPLVHSELRRIAQAHLRRERHNHTLQPTALVNEAYVRLVDQRRTEWKNRAHFLNLASQLMRRILVDHARARKTSKRQGMEAAVTLDDVHLVTNAPDIDLVVLDEALRRLAREDERLSHVVEMKFFGGLTIDEMAEVLCVSTPTVERDWAMARAWLRRELSREAPGRE
jgi:RNA polymerase sigma factor (TIGR02999 family)